MLQAVISYRSIPRTLDLIQRYFPSTTCWKPHFTSVINWTLRLGLGLLHAVKPLDNPWLAIIDHSIDIGTKKALVVLRVRLDTLSTALDRPAGALRRSDCECIGLRVAETVNGEQIQHDLTAIFKQAGCPAGIIKDGDATLNKGVRLWAQQETGTVEIIDDISHVVANALKKHYVGAPAYPQFVTWTSQVAKKFRQTAFAFLIPPKLRQKGRFMSIGRLAKWGKKLATRLHPADQDNAESAPLSETSPLSDVDQHLPFIKEFAHTTLLVSNIMRVLKQQGMQSEAAQTCQSWVAQLKETTTIRPCLNTWLDKHLRIQQRLKVDALPVSSDVIESLFGSFKYIMARNPQADMNRSVLLIPALCGASHLNDRQISVLLARTQHKALQAWEAENIPYTLRKKRQEFFNRGKPKNGK